ncbi:type III secretion system inner membrane ring subunit SctD [Parachitinimonas caeni]|uniref:Type III secretion system inner membrane ring subunit SctD n=1 Tax=Parachitinimonas caeni TaxID=3031301 RepID=A0ABT7DTU5_9NEIS|nr:type III secretion system inner membrane ring subunit SctD [Parachitinimonas caeni]MDK2123478.1 type III secretion system inner membrane ring subunit SctD [Parachitinimonas caeni]
MTTVALELRVIHGIQAGARLPLAEGSYLLGSGERADVVLRGPAISEEHATLTISANQITLTPGNGPITLANGSHIQSAYDLAIGATFCLGGIWLCVDEPASAWPAPIELIAPAPIDSATRDSSADQTNDQPALPPPPRTEPALGTLPENDLAAPSADHQHNQRPKAFFQHILLSSIAIVVIGTVLFVVFSKRPSEQPQQAKLEPKQQLLNAIKASHLSSHYKLQAVGDGFIVNAHVKDDAARAALARQLLSLPVKSTLRITTDANLLAGAQPIIEQSGLPIKVTATGGGSIQITGAAPGSDRLEQLLQSLQEEVPGIRHIDNQVLLPDDLISQLKAALGRADLLSKVKLIAATRDNQRTLDLSGTLSADDFDRWEKLFTDFTQRYGSMLPIKASFIRLARPLPFGIRSVVGGDMPYVITQSGEKIIAGGKIGAYRLASVSDSEIIFEGPERVRVAR